LRPSALKEAYADRTSGRITQAELHAAQDLAVRAVVRKQEALGLPVLTDGEFRRVTFQDSFAASVSGFAAEGSEHASEADVVRDWNPGFSGPVGPGAMRRRRVVQRIRLDHHLPLEEYRFASDLTGRLVKTTLVSPDRVIQRFAYERSRDVYESIEEFVIELVDIERQMVGQLVAAGCSYIQLDAPGYTAYVDPRLEQMRARGEDPEANLARSIEADNAVIEGFDGVTFGLHICRGNQAGRWHREGHYDAIAERLFSSLAHDRFLLEYDTERAGGFEPLRFVPKGKVAVLGLVSTKEARLEGADELRRRVDQASRFLPLEQLAVSPQCGFASDLTGNPVTEDDQWKKLALVREIAEQVWG
jgi:5-methyltetrahydropteroyltriglutamate--homocysteine methyltransferase